MTSLDIGPSIDMDGIKTVFPKVISASRATDIPAWHSQWFMERLRAGHCQWQNPFNASQRQTVSFADTEAIVFWSKNPDPLYPHLREIEDRGIKFYFQFTLNDYGHEGLEPGVPELKRRINSFSRLSRNYKVVWRYDPVILGDSLTIKSHLLKLFCLMDAIGQCASKLVFSFVDLYGHVAMNLNRLRMGLRSPDREEMKIFAQELSELRDRLAPKLPLATCAEVDVPFIDTNSCIDPVLINLLCGHEIYKRKRPGASAIQLSLLDTPEPQIMIHEKDKGQRKDCHCAPSKDIGSYRIQACGHHCVYCYAGHAR